MPQLSEATNAGYGVRTALGIRRHLCCRAGKLGRFVVFYGNGRRTDSQRIGAIRNQGKTVDSCANRELGTRRKTGRLHHLKLVGRS